MDLILQVRSALPDTNILIVDDNSPDQTAKMVREAWQADDRVDVIVREHERGLGSATLVAIERAIEGQFDYFINLDGDLSHNPVDLPRLLRAAQDEPQIDVVIGSRYVSGGKIVGWPKHRRIMSGIVNRFAGLCLRLPVKDCSGSIRCYRVSALSKLDRSKLKCTGYALLEELLVRLQQNGSKMSELPITFTDRTRGSSKLTFSEALRSAGYMIRLAFTK